MKLTKFAQSTIRLENNAGGSLLFDPGSYNVEPGLLDRSDALVCDVLVITHKHADHFDPNVLKHVTAKEGKPLTLCGADMAPLLAELGFPTRLITPGQTQQICGFTITVTKAVHIVRGEDVPVFGTIIEADGKRIYHSSDTQFRNPEELGVSGMIDAALLPFSGREVVMTEDEAIEFVRLLKPELLIPVHYDSPKDAGLLPAEFAARTSRATGVRCTVMSFGDSVVL